MLGSRSPAWSGSARTSRANLARSAESSRTPGWPRQPAPPGHLDGGPYATAGVMCVDREGRLARESLANAANACLSSPNASMKECAQSASGGDPVAARRPTLLVAAKPAISRCAGPRPGSRRSPGFGGTRSRPAASPAACTQRAALLATAVCNVTWLGRTVSAACLGDRQVSPRGGHRRRRHVFRNRLHIADRGSANARRMSSPYPWPGPAS